MGPVEFRAHRDAVRSVGFDGVCLWYGIHPNHDDCLTLAEAEDIYEQIRQSLSQFKGDDMSAWEHFDRMVASLTGGILFVMGLILMAVSLLVLITPHHDFMDFLYSEAVGLVFVVAGRAVFKTSYRNGRPRWQLM